MPVDAAGIGIFAEGRLQPGATSSGIGLSDELDGFRGTVGYAGWVGPNACFLGLSCFELLGLGVGSA